MKLIFFCWISAVALCLPVYGARGVTTPDRGRRHRAQYGVASWYGEKDQGHLMASGQLFDENAMVAAHRTLPLGTRVEVTNLQNGRSVIVRIMDRGPHVADRIIDLSKAAAGQLRFTHQGLASVKILVLSIPNTRPTETNPPPERQVATLSGR